jgi:hypothetical protein
MGYMMNAGIRWLGGGPKGGGRRETDAWPSLKWAACARVAVGAVLTREKSGQKMRDEKEGWESARRDARDADIYISGRAGDRD